ncbi:MAG TPA: hypothetical protein DCZ95_01190 [Verrucomicrobia bacterium]|nr:hypothetical protein [Verrucomicrobiota bacterium]
MSQPAGVGQRRSRKEKIGGRGENAPVVLRETAAMTIMREMKIPLIILLALCVCAIVFQAQWRRPIIAVIQIMKGKKTVDDRVAQFGATVCARLAPAFEQVDVAYPPKKMMLVGLKAERMLEVWISGPDGEWKHLKNYPILGMSGKLGPKLKEGDMQVPEGIYRVESLNPNSLYHLALRVNYPNLEDLRRAGEDGRTELGSDIMIHGKNCSIGCLAMGDEAAEDLFILATQTGIDNVSIILSPVDLRSRPAPLQMTAAPKWIDELYSSIKTEMEKLGELTTNGACKLR